MCSPLKCTAHNCSVMCSPPPQVYRSSLTCTSCRRQSNTFDPFLSVSLPIPQKTRRPLYVTVVYLDATPRQVRIGLLLNQGDTVRELRHTLAADTKIPESQVSVCMCVCVCVCARPVGARVRTLSARCRSHRRVCVCVCVCVCVFTLEGRPGAGTCAASARVKAQNSVQFLTRHVSAPLPVLVSPPLTTPCPVSHS